MTGLDCNILVQIAIADHPANERTLVAVQSEMERGAILDTHLAAVLHTNGVRRLLTSNPGDFILFDVLETICP